MLDNLLDQSMPKELWDLSNSLWGDVAELFEPKSSVKAEETASDTEENDSHLINNHTDTNNADNTDESGLIYMLRPLMDIHIEPPRIPRRLYSRRSQRTISGSSSSSDSNTCGYCRNLNYSYIGHTKLNCPVLASMDPCYICGAGGKDNHTATHCPLQMKTKLALKKEFLMRWLRRRRGVSPL